jgi:hypothetical protein
MSVISLAQLFDRALAHSAHRWPDCKCCTVIFGADGDMCMLSVEGFALGAPHKEVGTYTCTGTFLSDSRADNRSCRSLDRC